MRNRLVSGSRLLCVAAALLLLVGCKESSKKRESPTPRSTDELRQAIESVLQETRTPGAGVVLVSKDQVLWAAGVGSADLATGREVTPDTMFRAGSISKSFVALALMKLQEQGKVRLDDRLQDLVGDIEFGNAWEDTDALRLVHLLEHTSGFDDIAVREYAASVPNSNHRESLAFDPRPRNCRWRPGRFFSYSNAGYALAGYAVEQASGQPFDRFMNDELFAPLEMTSATFRSNELARQRLATAYGPDGVTPTPYEHILGRASGALNVTPTELAHLVQMLLNRGTFRGTRLLEPESIARLEAPATGLGAAGRAGYGLGNYAAFHNGFRLRGHSGALTSFVARYAYAPDHGVGYVIMLNSGSHQALEQIDKLILGYLSRDWGAAPNPPTEPSDERLSQFEGYYEPHTPRLELGRFVERLVGIQHVAVARGGLKVRGLADEPQTLLPAGKGGLFRGEEEPEATIAFVEADGQMYAVGSLPGRTNYRRVPGWQVWGQMAVAGYCGVMMLSTILFAMVWAPRKLFGRMRDVRHLNVRIWPLLAVFWLVVAVGVLVAAAADNPIQRLGVPTIWSVGFCALTWIFAGTAAVGFAQAVRARRWEMNTWVRCHALLVSVANVVVASYLGYWGIIGWRTWA